MRRPPSSLRRRWPAEFLAFSASSDAALVDRMKQVRAWLAAASDADLKHAARTLSMEGVEAPCRLSIVASSAREGCARIDSAIDRLIGSNGGFINDPRGIYRFDRMQLDVDGDGVAFLFPGDGAQYRGMFADLCLEFPEVRRWFDFIDGAASDADAGPPSRLIYPGPDDHRPDDSVPELWEPGRPTELVFAACQGMRSLLDRLGVKPHAVAGHCAGDHSAHLAAGTLQPIDDGTLMQYVRGIDATLEGVASGTIFGVPAAAAQIISRIQIEAPNAVFVALDNCAQQLVVWCDDGTAERVIATLRGADINPVMLPFRRAFHTPLAAQSADRLLALLDTIEFHAPRLPLYSCVSARRYPDDPVEIRRLAASVWRRPVRFRETVEAMYDAGSRVFIEVGPRGNLTGFVRSILEGRPHLAVATDLPSRAGLVQLQHVAAQLFAAGVPFEPDHLYVHRDADVVAFDTPASRRVATPAHLVRLNARMPRLRAPVDEKTSDARAPRSTPEPTPPAGASHRAGRLDGYFAAISHLIEVERDVMLAALQAAEVPERVDADLPFVREVMSLVPGQSATVRCALDIEEDRFLIDHRLGCGPSRDGSLRPGLSVVPLTVGIEMLAEAAALVLPGRRVAEIADVEMSRWLALEGEQLVLEFTATRRDDEAVDVQLREASTDQVAPSLRGTIVLRDTLPSPPAASGLELIDAKPSAAADPSEIYADPRMFHGPLFQSLRRAVASGRNGIKAQLVNPESAGFFRTRRADRLLVHPALLDGMGQVIGCWVFDYFESESVFPLRVARLQFFQDTIPAGAPTACQVHVLRVQGPWIEANLELIDAEGRLLASIEGWVNRRVRVPRSLYAFMLDPARGFLSIPLPTRTTDGATRCTVALDDLSAELSDGGMIWMRTLAHTSLTRRERAQWGRVPNDAAARIDWLAERVAAKDSVRLLLRETGGRELHPAEIAIDAAGPGFTASWDGCPRPLSIALAREPGRLLATASLEDPAFKEAHDGVSVYVQ